MATQWYVSQDDLELELPLTYHQVIDLMKTQPDARYLVWKEGMESWEDPNHLDLFKEELSPSIRLGIESAKGIGQLLNADDWGVFFRGDNHIKKHLVLTAILTSLISITSISTPQGVPFQYVIWVALLTALASVLPCYFVSGRAFTGHWPHLDVLMRIVGLVLGPVRSLRRRMIYSFFGPILILPGSLILHGHPDLTQSIITFSTFWFFLGFYSRWDSILTKPVLIPNLECGAFTFRKKVLERIKLGQIPGLAAEDIKFVEPDYSGSQEIIKDGESEYVLQLTINRARLIIKVKDQGNFLFIRWESFILNAHRRIFLLLLLAYNLLDNLLYRWTSSNLKEIYDYIMRVLFDWNPMVTAGNSDGGSFSRAGKMNHLPSHVLDSLFTLERAADFIIDQCLAEEIVDESLIKPKIPIFSSLQQDNRMAPSASRP